MLCDWTDRSHSPETLRCLLFPDAGLTGTPKCRSVPLLFLCDILSILCLSNTEKTWDLSVVMCVGSALPEQARKQQGDC